MRRIGERSALRWASARSSATTSAAPTRAQVVAKWRGSPAQATEAATSSPSSGGVISRALAFASSGSSVRKPAPTVAGQGNISDISWDACERLDHAFTYYAPRGWLLEEKVRENFISIELTPPRRPPTATADAAPEDAPTSHGLTITAYAYYKKVSEPDSDKLMEVFLRRFNQCMNNSVEILKRSAPKAKTPVDGTGRPLETAPPAAMDKLDQQDQANLPEVIASRLGGSACEFSFTPTFEVVPLPSSERGTERVGRARGLCRAFFHTNRLHHYVVVMAVPEEEFEASWDLVAHAVLGVRELRVPNSS